MIDVQQEAKEDGLDEVVNAIRQARGVIIFMLDSAGKASFFRNLGLCSQIEAIGLLELGRTTIMNDLSESR